MSYKSLEIWKISRVVVLDIYILTMKLPKHEMYETGSQIRRSSASIKANIVEGYGRKKYKKDFIRFLIIASASRDETLDHLETLYEKGLISNQSDYKKIHTRLHELGRMLHGFIQAVEKND